MKPFQYAIIGGTGVYDSDVFSFQKTVEKEYGKVEVDIAEVKKNSIVFLARHGKEHGAPSPTA
jgi:5'-methylthioadenosine phosphorylase